MIRCKPLLGTFVEISVRENEDELKAVVNAFTTIQRVQDLMGFHNPVSELSFINQLAHKEAVEVHPWTAQVIKIAKEIHLASDGLFNCGIGHRLVAAGLLPRHITFANHDLGDPVLSSRPHQISSTSLSGPWWNRQRVCSGYGGEGFNIRGNNIWLRECWR